MQVLSFMRTGVHVMDKEVLSVCLNQKGLQLRHAPTRFRKAIEELQYGKSSDTKDFLDMSLTTGTVINRKTSARKRAANVFLHKLPTGLQDQIRKGDFFYVSAIACLQPAYMHSPSDQ